jgi:hypothetical protein
VSFSCVSCSATQPSFRRQFAPYPASKTSCVTLASNQPLRFKLPPAMNSSQAGPSGAAAQKTFGAAPSGETSEAHGETSKKRLLQPLSLSEVNAPRMKAAVLGPGREGGKGVAAGAGVQRVTDSGGAAPGGSASGIAQRGLAVASPAPEERVHGDSTGEMDAGGEATVDPRQDEGAGEGWLGIPAMPGLADDASEALALEEGMPDEIGDQEEEPTYEVLAPALRALTTTDRDPTDVAARRRALNANCRIPAPFHLVTLPTVCPQLHRPLHPALRHPPSQELKYQLYDTTNRLSRCTVLLQRMVDENESLKQGRASLSSLCLAFCAWRLHFSA